MRQHLAGRGIKAGKASAGILIEIGEVIALMVVCRCGARRPPEMLGWIGVRIVGRSMGEPHRV